MRPKYNEKVRSLCADIPTREPNWNCLFERIKPAIYRDERPPIDPGTLVNIVAEHHIKECLQHKCETTSFGFDVTLGNVPIPDSAQFRFENHDGTIMIYGPNDPHRSYSQITFAANIDGIPAFFEVFVGKYVNKGGKGTRKKRFSKTDRDRIFLPIRQTFGRNFTYTFIVAEDTFKAVHRGWSNLAQLGNMGAIVIPLYATRQRFRRDVNRWCKEKNIKIRK